MKRIACFLAATPLLASCQGEPPRELKLELPALIDSKEPVLVHAKAIAKDGTARTPSGNLEYRVTPSDLASVVKGGVLTCLRSGDGSVALTFLGVTGQSKFACKLAARLEAPGKLSLDAASGNVAPQIKVMDAAGKELELPVTLTSDRGNVVQVRNGQLVPGDVGNAKLTARVGQLSKAIEVEVVRSLKPEALPVDQNRRISFSLDPGKYRLTLKLSSPHRVSIDWLGAPYCAYRADGAEHRADCTLPHKGSVSFDNPAFLLRGDKTPSIEGVTLQEVP